MKGTNMELLKHYFNFLSSIFNFKLEEIKSFDYALYAKFLSDSVGVYFIYEFRDSIPQIQFSILKTDELKIRPGLYAIRELYKDKNFRLLSFYLDEIILYKKEKEYKSCFKNSKTIEDTIEISSELVKQYAEDFIVGDEESYDKINTWFRTQVTMSE